MKNLLTCFTILCAVSPTLASTVIDVPAGATAADINAAIQAVDEGGTVNLSEAVYVVDASIVLNRSVTLRGAGRDLTVLDGRNEKLRGVTISHSDAVLADLGIRAFNGQNASYARGSAVSMSAGLVENCRIANNLCCGYGSGCAGIYMTGGKVINCVIDGNKADTAGGPDHSGAGIYMTAGTVEGCLIANNWSAKTEANYNNAYALTETYGGGVYMKGNSSLVNCTVCGNYARRNGGGVYVSGTTARLVNCLISDNGCNWADSAFGGDFAPASATNLLDHCIVGGAPSDHGRGLGGWAALTDPANGDFSLSDASSGIGSGRVDLAFERENDLNGNPRVHGGYADIGCHARVGERAGCSVDGDRRVAVRGATFRLRALRQYAAVGACTWSVTCPDGTVLPLEGDEPSLTFAQVGAYAVALSVGGVSASRSDFLSVPATNYVVAGATAPEYPFDTPEKATASLKDALDAATDGSTVLVSGTVMASKLRLFHDIAVVGLGPDLTTVDGNNQGRVFDLNSPGARVENLTLRRGFMKSSDYGYYSCGSGARIGFVGGTITKCCVMDCQTSAGPYYQSGGGIAIFGKDAKVTHSRISNCWCWNGDGGGVVLYDGLLDNCLVDNNTARKNGQPAYGGGIDVPNGNGKVRNCTIVANKCTDNQGGGVYFKGKPAEGQFVNCLIAENVANNQTFVLGKPDWALATDTEDNRTAAQACFVNCAFETCAAIGEGSVTVSAPFVDAPDKDYHVLGSAVSVDKGCLYDGISDRDLDGLARMSGAAPDIGCYEVDKNKFAPTFDVSPTEVIAGSSVRLTPDLNGAPAGVRLGCRWTFTNGAGYSFSTEGIELDQTFDRGGRYTIRMEVIDADRGEPLAEYVRDDLLLVSAPVIYVTSKVQGATPVEPFDTLETASTNVNEAVDRYAASGCRVELDGGLHYLRRTLEITKAVTVSGAGSDRTFVTCAASFDPKQRTVYLNHEGAVVSDLTVTGIGNRNGDYYVWGPNCYIGSNCGTIRYCTISNVTVTTLYSCGIGVAMLSDKGRISHCLIADNKVQFHDNVGSTCAVAVKGGLMDNCVVRNNRVDGPAGILVGGTARVYNCTVTGNVSTNESSRGGTLTDYQSAANGLFINDAYGDFADLEKCRIVNCIFADNVGKSAAWGPEYGWTDPNVDGSRYTPIIRSCLFKFADPEASVGTGCVNGDPKFIDAAAYDYRVQGDSPAKKKGKVETWMKEDGLFGTDFGGAPRLVQPHHLDLGAYESGPLGFSLQVR